MLPSTTESLQLIETLPILAFLHIHSKTVASATAIVVEALGTKGKGRKGKAVTGQTHNSPEKMD